MIKEQQKERFGLLKRTFCFALLTLPAFALSGQAQTIVKGTVLDPAGEPLVGVTVMANGSSKTGAVTDIDGHYTLKMGGAKC